MLTKDVDGRWLVCMYLWIHYSIRFPTIILKAQKVMSIVHTLSFLLCVWWGSASVDFLCHSDVMKSHQFLHSFWHSCTKTKLCKDYNRKLHGNGAKLHEAPSLVRCTLFCELVVKLWLNINLKPRFSFDIIKEVKIRMDWRRRRNTTSFGVVITRYIWVWAAKWEPTKGYNYLLITKNGDNLWCQHLHVCVTCI